jgi:hypothetical protein
LEPRQGLGFVVADTVLDKRKLRTIYAAVVGMFTTVVPLLLAFNSGSHAGVVFGSFANSDTIFAYNGLTRSYSDTVAFCEELWMFPAVLDPSRISEDSLQSVMENLVGVNNEITIGAVRGEDGNFQWDDGTPWTQQTSDITQYDSGKPTLYLQLDGDTRTVRWKATNNPKGVLCMGTLSGIEPSSGFGHPETVSGAQDINLETLDTNPPHQKFTGPRITLVAWIASAGMKGAIPTIRNLAHVTPPVRTPCDLTRPQRDLIKSAVQSFAVGNSTCDYNITLRSIVES